MRPGAYDDFVLVDGLQRLTTLRLFVENKLPLFGTLYRDYATSGFSHRHTIRVNVNDLKTKAEVLTWYLETNAGGTPHTAKDLNKVRKLLRKEKKT